MLTAARAVGVLVLVKVVDVAARGPAELPAVGWAVALAVFAAGGLGLVLVGACRACWVAVAAGAVGIALDLPLELRLQHLVLVLGVAVAAAVSLGPVEQLVLWRLQLSALYGVAALSKLNETFLSGNVLSQAVFAAPSWSSVLPRPPLAVVVLAGVALVATECLLAVAPWVTRLRGPGALLAVAFHTATLLLVTDAPVVGLRLVVFGGTAVVLHAASAGWLPVATRSPSSA